jgi:hypothetical protein
MSTTFARSPIEFSPARFAGGKTRRDTGASRATMDTSISVTSHLYKEKATGTSEKAKEWSSYALRAWPPMGAQARRTCESSERRKKLCA